MSTPEARLAAALHDFGIDQMADCVEAAAAIFAADPTIARHMALGAAVERHQPTADSDCTCGASVPFCEDWYAHIDAALRDPEGDE